MNRDESLGFLVTYYEDQNEVHILPSPSIPAQHMGQLILMYSDLGYKFWLPGSEKGAFVFSKVKK